MSATTIKIETKTKSNLDTFREYKNESYNEVVEKLIYIASNITKKPTLSIETVEAIEKARARIKKGDFLTEEEMKKRLGF